MFINKNIIKFVFSISLLDEMQRVASSPIAIVTTSVYPCIRVSALFLDSMKTIWYQTDIFSPSCMPQIAIQRCIRRRCSSWPWPTLWISKIRIETISVDYYYCQYIEKSLIGFHMVYLHLTLVHSKGQSQGGSNFESEYLVNGEK